MARPRESLNKLNFRRFVERCRGARIHDVQVDRAERGGQIFLKYAARATRGTMRLNGEWVINRKGRDEAQLAELEKDFLTRLKDNKFMVRKGPGFRKSASEDGDEAASEDGATEGADESAEDKGATEDAESTAAES